MTSGKRNSPSQRYGNKPRVPPSSSICPQKWAGAPRRKPVRARSACSTSILLLLDLCGLPKNPKNEGRSIAPLVRNPKAKWPYPAVITHSPHWHGTNHAVRSERFHYIHYGKGGEELYEMAKDPHQWNNLAEIPSMTKPRPN